MANETTSAALGLTAALLLETYNPPVWVARRLRVVVTSEATRVEFARGVDVGGNGRQNRTEMAARRRTLCTVVRAESELGRNWCPEAPRGAHVCVYADSADVMQGAVCSSIEQVAAVVAKVAFV